MREFIELIENDRGIFITLEIDDHADAFAVGFVAQIGNAGYFFVAHEFGDFFDQHRLVDLIRQFRDDNAFFVGTAVLFNQRARADFDDAAAGFIRGQNAFAAVDKSGGGKIRPRNVTHQLFNGDRWILDAGDGAVDNFHYIMRRNIRRHADGNARCAVEQQQGNARSQHRRLCQRFIIVGNEIDGLFFQIGHHLVGNARQAAFRVTHGRGRIAVNRPEVALAVHQHVAQRKILRHAHQRVINRRVAVRMILTHDIADDTGAFLVRFIMAVARFIHGI